jgi:DNA-binding CsgD family transcriptional regulator
MLHKLRSGHVHYISESEMESLVYFALGYAVPEIAVTVAESEATVRRHIRRVREAATARVGLVLSQDLFRTWLWCHVDDCTAQIPDLIGDEQLLSAVSHRRA